MNTGQGTRTLGDRLPGPPGRAGSIPAPGIYYGCSTAEGGSRNKQAVADGAPGHLRHAVPPPHLHASFSAHTLRNPLSTQASLRFGPSIM